ncbi:fibril-forming collagen alpha chain-like [Myotis daubentonii]|uniref:fibril-forming collagen alpha chain-like n=1 Tax=Myotis daubentonii TaxID=98922 RepID=UPI00287353BE|nr:fibril-forming collagen alpha chain-like [Myotis daubentonii]XP_059562781.1 fibril-forming collagen alpha chain-like [Myotis daubentonii]XP_059562783.1 fibril-forming collagen alpha chain-like [Myotis daubentonii]
MTWVGRAAGRVIPEDHVSGATGPGRPCDSGPVGRAWGAGRALGRLRQGTYRARCGDGAPGRTGSKRSRAHSRMRGSVGPPDPARAGGVHQQGLGVRRAAAWCAADRFCPSVAHPGRLGWRRQQPGVRLERRALATQASLPLAPAASPSPGHSVRCFLFRQHFEGAGAPQGVGGCSGSAPRPPSAETRQGGGQAGPPGAHCLLARTPGRFHRRDSVLAPQSGMPAQKARTSLVRDSPGALSDPGHTHSHTDACPTSSSPLPVVFEKTHTQLCTHTRVSSHSCGFVDIFSQEIWVTPTCTRAHTQR